MFDVERLQVGTGIRNKPISPVAFRPLRELCPGSFDNHILKSIKKSTMQEVKNILQSIPKIKGFQSGNGNDVPNQYIIKTKDYCIFQSYDTIIAVQIYGQGIYLDEQKWDYSRTTGKYRNQFLGMDKKETLEAIKNGRIELTNLN